MPTKITDPRVWIIACETQRTGFATWDFDSEDEARDFVAGRAGDCDRTQECGYLYTAVFDRQGNCTIEDWSEDVDAARAADRREERAINADYYASR